MSLTPLQIFTQKSPCYKKADLTGFRLSTENKTKQNKTDNVFF